MKNIHLLAAAFAAAIVSPRTALRAQTLSVTSPGYARAKLFDATPGFTITGLGASPSGKIFYLESDSAQTASAKLYRRSPGDNYMTPTLLHDLGAPVFGSFVRVVGKNVFFAESSVGGIFSIKRDGRRFDELGTVTGNYDLASNGSSLFLSADPTFTSNQVFELKIAKDGPGDRRISGMRSVLDTDGDFSGPITFDGAGSLFYGAAKSSKNGVFRYSSAELATGSLVLDDAHRLVGNGGNTALAYGGHRDLWQDSFSGPLSLIDRKDGTVLEVATSADSLGQLDFAGETLFVNVTDFGTNRSAVFAVIPSATPGAPVPEPGSSAFLAGMLALLTVRVRHSTQP